MSRFFLGCLALCALALMVGQAIAEANHHPATNGDGVVIVETYTASSSEGSGNQMQPLEGNPGVEVAPDNSSAAQPVMVEEDMMIEQSSEE